MSTHLMTNTNNNHRTGQKQFVKLDAFCSEQGKHLYQLRTSHGNSFTEIAVDAETIRNMARHVNAREKEIEEERTKMRPFAKYAMVEVSGEANQLCDVEGFITQAINNTKWIGGKNGELDSFNVLSIHDSNRLPED